MNEPEPGRTSGEVVEIHPRPEADAAPTEPPPAKPEAPPAVDEKALRGEIDHLQAAAEKASGHVRNLYLFFLSFGLYLAIIFGATTHEQLLRAAPVTLPLFNVDLPLLGFFWVAPALFVLLHFNLLLQCRLLAGKVQRLDAAIRRLADPGRQAIERARLDVFTLTQLLLGRHNGGLMRALLWLIVVLTMLTLPVVLLLFGQVRFLPYHDAATTIWHRSLVALDVFLLLIFWRPIRHPEDQPLARPGRWLWHQGMALPGTLTALAFSWLILTFPGDESRDWGDPMEERLFALLQLNGRFAHLYLRENWKRHLRETVTHDSSGQPVWAPTRYLFDWLGLNRHLVVSEANLVDSWPTQAQVDQYGEDLAWQNFGAPPNLRGRDLRYADLSRTILVRGDFRDAKLQGAVLVEANLEGARLNSANLQDAELCDGRGFGCPNLEGASLVEANLVGTRLVSARLQGAHLGRANLQGVELRGADLRGAIGSADLQGANLQGAQLQNASLFGANLQGASLFGANLQGASLRSANAQRASFSLADLSGADLTRAGLQGANFSGASLEGASLFGAQLHGAIMSCQLVEKKCTSLKGADLRIAHLWGVQLDDRQDLSDRWILVDLREVNLDPIEDPNVVIQEATRGVLDEQTRSRIAEGLRWALQDGDPPAVPSFPQAWRFGPNVIFHAGDALAQRLGWGPQVWEVTHDFQPGLAPRLRVLGRVDAYDEDLAWFLAELACGEDGTVNVARGLAERARWDEGRHYAQLLAERLTGDDQDCPAAAGLPDDLRADLRRLAGR